MVSKLCFSLVMKSCIDMSFGKESFVLVSVSSKFLGRDIATTMLS